MVGFVHEVWLSVLVTVSEYIAGLLGNGADGTTTSSRYESIRNRRTDQSLSFRLDLADRTPAIMLNRPDS